MPNSIFERSNGQASPPQWVACSHWQVRGLSRHRSTTGKAMIDARKGDTTEPGDALPLPVSIVRRVIAGKPALQLEVRVISPVGSDPVGVRRVDRQLDYHSVRIGNVERRTVTVLKDKAVGLTIARRR